MYKRRDDEIAWLAIFGAWNYHPKHTWLTKEWLKSSSGWIHHCNCLCAAADVQVVGAKEIENEWAMNQRVVFFSLPQNDECFYIWIRINCHSQVKTCPLLHQITVKIAAGSLTGFLVPLLLYQIRLSSTLLHFSFSPPTLENKLAFRVASPAPLYEL